MPLLRFGVFEVDPDSGELRKRGSRLRLREQPFCLLLTLIEQAGRVVTREHLRHRLWPAGTFVEFDRAINKAVSELRGALGDSASSPRFVETVSKRGYRFVCSVEGNPRALWDSTSDGFPSDAQRACLTGASDFSNTRWKSMRSMRLLMRGWQTRTCCLLSGGSGLLMSHSARRGVRLHERSN